MLARIARLDPICLWLRPRHLRLAPGCTKSGAPAATPPIPAVLGGAAAGMAGPHMAEEVLHQLAHLGRVCVQLRLPQTRRLATRRTRAAGTTPGAPSSMPC